MQNFWSNNKEYIITALIVLFCIVAGLVLYHLVIDDKIEEMKAKNDMPGAAKTVDIESSVAA